MKIYKLSFEDKDEWVSTRSVIYEEPEDGFPVNSTYTLNGDTIREVGNVPYPATYNEDGEIVTEAGYYDDFAVDILTENTYDLNQYLVVGNSSWYHSFAGLQVLIVEAIPDSSWTVVEIKNWLDANGISYTSSMLKADLLALCQ